MNITTPEITLVTIENASKIYADRHNDLADMVTTLNDELAAIKRRFLPMIKKRVNEAAEAKARLEAFVDHGRHLFESPRTLILHGIKVGLRKGTGGIDWDDDARVVALIKKNFTKSQADLLIKTTEKPIKKALEDLDLPLLKAIGVRVEQTGDAIVIKPVDSDVDKLVTALLKDATETNDN